MTKTQSKKGKAPTHSAYSVREYGFEQSYWTKIGSAWPHSDGEGFNLQLELMPFDGKITVRPVKDKADTEAETGPDTAE